MGKKWRFPVYIGISVCLWLLSSLLSEAQQSGVHAQDSQTTTSDQLISAHLPAFSSDTCFGKYPASFANDGDYGTYWQSCAAAPSPIQPITLTYNIASLPLSVRSTILLVWYNDSVTGQYDYVENGTKPYNLPRDYAIQVNTLPDASSPPQHGWNTLVTVTGNTYHSREHILHLDQANWIRLSITASSGDAPNDNISLNMDLYDIHTGDTNDWIFFGDSITAQAFLHWDTYKDPFGQQVHAYNPNYYPVDQDGGIGGSMSSDGVNHIHQWLSHFAGRYVTLNYGTNDAQKGIDATMFYQNMATLVHIVFAAGKIPVVPTIPWGCTPILRARVPLLNVQIQQLYHNFPKITHGPDLYTFFKLHTEDISSDCIHPSDPQGYTDYLTQWVKIITAEILRN